MEEALIKRILPHSYRGGTIGYRLYDPGQRRILVAFGNSYQR